MLKDMLHCRMPPERLQERGKVAHQGGEGNRLVAAGAKCRKPTFFERKNLARSISIRKGRLLSIFRRFSRPNAPLPSPHKEGDELQKATHLAQIRLLF